MMSMDHYELVRTNTTRVKIDDQWDISTAVSDTIVELEEGSKQGVRDAQPRRDLDPENSTPAKWDD
jgi:hypothetical protein